MAGGDGVRVVDPQGTNYSVQVVDQFTYNSQSSGTLPGLNIVTSNIPSLLFYDSQFPNGVINIWPTPTSAWSLYFVSKLAISEAANYSSAVSLPLGYNIMLKRNLAKWLLPYFGSAVSQIDRAQITADARETLAIVKRANTKTPMARFDASLPRRAAGTFNIQTYGR